MEMYERIKTVRKDVGMSQNEFAEHLGVTRSVISNLELNRLAKPEQKTSLIKLISREFNVNEDWLLTGEGEMYIVSEQDEKLAEAFAEISLSENEKLKEIVQNLTKLDDKTIDKINDLIDLLLEKENKI